MGIPKNRGRTKFTIHQYSSKLFCKGEPVKAIRRRVWIFVNALRVAPRLSLMRCASSATTRSGPGDSRYLRISLCTSAFRSASVFGPPVPLAAALLLPAPAPNDSSC